MNWDAWLAQHYRSHPPRPRGDNPLRTVSEVLSRGFFESVLANLYEPGPFTMLLAQRMPEPKLTIRNGEVDWDFFLTRFYLKHPPTPKQEIYEIVPDRPSPFEVMVGNAGASV